MPVFISTPSLCQQRQRQRGASSLENTVSLLAFLLLALATYESAHWLLLRQALNTALLDTARIAATQQAHPKIINEAFREALQQLPAFAFKHDTHHWHIEKLSQHQRSQYDYQALQYQAGNHSVFDDNTLHLKLRYQHRPTAPIIRHLFTEKRILITTEVKVAMQSDQYNKPSTAAPSHLRPPTQANPIKLSKPPTSSPPSLPLAPWQPPTHTWQPPISSGTQATPIEGCNDESCCGPSP